MDTGCVQGPADESVTPRATILNTGDPTLQETIAAWKYDVNDLALDDDDDSLVLLVSTTQTNECRKVVMSVERFGATTVDIATRLSRDSCDLGTVGVSFVFVMTKNEPIKQVLLDGRPAELVTL